MGKDCNDLLNESIERLLEKLNTLDPASDEYRKVTDQLSKQYDLKIREESHQAEMKLKERHEENEEIMSEREYEETVKKNRIDWEMILARLGVDVFMFAVGLGFKQMWGNVWTDLEKTGTASSMGLREFFKGLIPGRGKN